MLGDYWNYYSFLINKSCLKIHKGISLSQIGNPTFFPTDFFRGPHIQMQFFFHVKPWHAHACTPAYIWCKKKKIHSTSEIQVDIRTNLLLSYPPSPTFHCQPNCFFSANNYLFFLHFVLQKTPRKLALFIRQSKKSKCPCCPLKSIHIFVPTGMSRKNIAYPLQADAQCFWSKMTTNFCGPKMWAYFLL